MQKNIIILFFDVIDPMAFLVYN